MINVIRSKSKPVSSILFTTLGIMWLSFAIAPCLLAASLIDNPHDCCPDINGIEYSEHMHDREECFACETIEPVSQSASEYIYSNTTTKYDYKPVSITQSSYQLNKSLSVVVKLPYQPFSSQSPPLKYRVLLI